MTDVQTKTLFEVGDVRASALADGTPLKRPIFFKSFRNGCYLSIAEARIIANDLLAAAATAQAAADEAGP